MAAGDVITIIESPISKKGNYFDGTDDYVLHDAHGVARVAANDTVGTYTAWIYIDTFAANTQTILSAGDNSSTNEFLQFLIEATSDKLTVILNHGGAAQFKVREVTASINAREWTHVAIVQDGTQPALYVNGINVAVVNVTSTDLTFWYDELTLVDKFAIGVLETNNTHLEDFGGAIGQVKYWSTNLTAAEIKIEAQEHLSHTTERQAALDLLLQFNVTMEDDGTTDAGLGLDNGTLTGDAHYGGEISTHSIKVEANSSGHAAEFINTFPLGDKFVSIIKRGD